MLINYYTKRNLKYWCNKILVSHIRHVILEFVTQTYLNKKYYLKCILTIWQSHILS